VRLVTMAASVDEIITEAMYDMFVTLLRKMCLLPLLCVCMRVCVNEVACVVSTTTTLCFLFVLVGETRGVGWWGMNGMGNALLFFRYFVSLTFDWMYCFLSRVLVWVKLLSSVPLIIYQLDFNVCIYSFRYAPSLTIDYPLYRQLCALDRVSVVWKCPIESALLDSGKRGERKEK
jgi:hypothetical protein